MISKEEKLIKKITTDEWSHYFWNGIISGYPLCCILFFCDVWTGLRFSKKMFSGKECHDWDLRMNYVLCPDCAVTCMCVRNPDKEKILKEVT